MWLSGTAFFLHILMKITSFFTSHFKCYFQYCFISGNFPFLLQKQLVLHYSLDDFLFEMDSIQLMLMLEMVSVMVAWESKTCLKWISVSVNYPKIWFWILLSGCFTFPCKLITRICCYIKTTTLPDKFCVISHYLFAGKSMDISGRSCMLIISVSYLGLMEANYEYQKRLLNASMYSWPVISHSFY